MTFVEKTHRATPPKEPGELFQAAADLLKAQGAPGAMLAPYQRAASIARTFDLAEVYEQDRIRGLMRLPKLTLGTALAVSEMLRTQSWSRLHWLEGHSSDTEELARIPTIGCALAARLRNVSGATTLEQLLPLARSHRLERISGFRRHRVATLERYLRQALGPTGDCILPEPPAPEILAKAENEFRVRVRTGFCYWNDGRRGGHPILHGVLGPWNCSMRFDEADRNAVLISLDRGDLLFEHFVVRTDDTGCRRVLGIGGEEGSKRVACAPEGPH